MKYIGKESDITLNNDKLGVLLVNLGTPEKPICPRLRDYLSEFLMDPRVIEIPKLFRALLVKGIIINVRNQGIRKIVAIPLYPQYSGSTNGSTFDAIGAALSKQRWVPNLHFVSDYYRYDNYIKAIGDSILAHWQEHGRNQKLVMSFHGIPKKYITRGDPYQRQCQESAQRIADYLNLTEDEWMLVFQSRFGAEEWLQPYCDKTLQSLPSQGIKSVDIVCPGFSADCLETLEEIEGENKEYFIEAGGESYSYIPCLNDSDSHAELISEIIKDTI